MHVGQKGGSVFQPNSRSLSMAMTSFSISTKSNKRLYKKEQYDTVFAKRKAIDSKSFKIFWTENNEGLARIGISVAKKNIAKAVSRNKFKRLAKEYFRLNSWKLPSVDIVLIAKRNAESNTTEALFTELSQKMAAIK